MRVMVIGSGGREHALAWKLGQSAQVSALFVAPGNAGTAKVAENVAIDITDHQAIIAACRRLEIEFVVIGPDAQVVAGLADDLGTAGILAFGPSKAAAQLEGSKSFTKALCDEMGIPTARYAHFSEQEAALDYVRAQGAPIVVKADGLAAGKGVTVATSLAEAEAAVRACFAGAFGAAGAEVVIEEMLVGEEVSLFAVCDGDLYVMLAAVQDHKRAFDNDTGPNTGGMGAYSPALVMTPDLVAHAERDIIAPTVAGMAARGTPFRGVLFAGLIITADGPKLIEHNVRFGDPECQVLMMRMQSDLLPLLLGAARGDLSGVAVEWRDDVALTVILATQGYPGSYGKGSTIRGAEDLDSDEVMVFHAGTARRGGELVANGGRVLNVTALGATATEAQARAYAAIAGIDWPEGFCRRDIGWRAVARER